MAYAITVIIHESGYVPAGPSTEHTRSTNPLETGATLDRTAIHHDDSEPVPAGTAEEVERYPIPVSVEQQSRWTLREQAETVAMPRLQTIIDDVAAGTVSNADAIQYLGWLAQHQRKLIRLVVAGTMLNATD